MHMLKQRLLLHKRLQGAPVSKCCILVRHCKSWRLLASLYLLIKQSHLPQVLHCMTSAWQRHASVCTTASSSAAMPLSAICSYMSWHSAIMAHNAHRDCTSVEAFARLWPAQRSRVLMALWSHLCCAHASSTVLSALISYMSLRECF